MHTVPIVGTGRVAPPGTGPYLHREAAEALLASVSGDPSPAVGKKAAWYAPGGATYGRTARPVAQ